MSKALKTRSAMDHDAWTQFFLACPLAEEEIERLEVAQASGAGAEGLGLSKSSYLTAHAS